MTDLWRYRSLSISRLTAYKYKSQHNYTKAQYLHTLKTLKNDLKTKATHWKHDTRSENKTHTTKRQTPNEQRSWIRALWPVGLKLNIVKRWRKTERKLLKTKISLWFWSRNQFSFFFAKAVNFIASFAIFFLQKDRLLNLQCKKKNISQPITSWRRLNWLLVNSLVMWYTPTYSIFSDLSHFNGHDCKTNGPDMRKQTTRLSPEG